MTLPLTTHQMAKKFGVTPRTLRHYDAIELLRPERHGPHRMFGPQDQAAMRLIEKGKAMGMSLEQIRQAMASDRSHLKVDRVTMQHLAFAAAEQRGMADRAIALIEQHFDAGVVA